MAKSGSQPPGTNEYDVGVQEHKRHARIESERIDAIGGIAKAAVTLAVFAAAIMCLGVPLIVCKYGGAEQSRCWPRSMGAVSFLVGPGLLIAAMVLCYLCGLSRLKPKKSGKGGP